MILICNFVVVRTLTFKDLIETSEACLSKSQPHRAETHPWIVMISSTKNFLSSFMWKPALHCSHGMGSQQHLNNSRCNSMRQLLDNSICSQYITLITANGEYTHTHMIMGKIHHVRYNRFHLLLSGPKLFRFSCKKHGFP